MVFIIVLMSKRLSAFMPYSWEALPYFLNNWSPAPKCRMMLPTWREVIDQVVNANVVTPSQETGA